MLRSEDWLNVNNFGVDVIDGYRPQIQRGSLTLTRALPATIQSGHSEQTGNLLTERTGAMEKQAALAAN